MSTAFHAESTLDYEAERAAARARIEAREQHARIEKRARRLLRVAGWNADADTLRAAAKQLWKVNRTAEIDDVVQRALELQHDDSVRGSHL